MNRRSQIIKWYFNSWLEKDISVLDDVFESNAVYIESFGPAYRNLSDIKNWFSDWNAKYNVIRWDIRNFFHDGDTCICEWYFECDCNEVEGFDGVSVIVFNDKNKIVSLKEFQCKTPNYFPYENRS